MSINEPIHAWSNASTPAKDGERLDDEIMAIRQQSVFVKSKNATERLLNNRNSGVQAQPNLESEIIDQSTNEAVTQGNSQSITSQIR